jgi:Lipocalin-like domain
MSPDGQSDIVGVWKLESLIHEDVGTGERKAHFGEHPAGYFVFTSSGRAVAILTGEGRKPPKTMQDRIDAYSSMLAYSGKYRIEGRTLITRVDIAWDQSMVGTEQIRYFKIDRDRLEIETPPFVVPLSDGKQVRGLLVWRREP